MPGEPPFSLFGHFGKVKSNIHPPLCFLTNFGRTLLVIATVAFGRRMDGKTMLDIFK